MPIPADIESEASEYCSEALSDFVEIALSYEEAQRLAYEHRFEIEEHEPRIELTVAEAIARYVEWMKIHRRTGPEVERRAALHILPSLGNFKISELTTHQLNGWRDKLAASPALYRTRPGVPHKQKPAPKTKDEQRARQVSANKCITILKAALNRSFKDGLVQDDKAWRRFESFDNVDIARERSLTVAEAQRLIDLADEPSGFRDILHAALLTGCRFGELSNLRVKDFANGKITISQSKSGKPRHVRLTDEGIEFFEQLTAGRNGEDHMLMNKRLGRQWRKSEQNRPMRAACARAGISPPVGIHQMRHTWARDEAHMGELGHYEWRAAASCRYSSGSRQHIASRKALRPSNIKLPGRGYPRRRP